MSSYFPPPAPPPYPYQPMPPVTRSSTMALVSLIAGIAGWSFLPFLGSIVAIITGHMAKSEIHKSGGIVTGGGMATFGLVLGYLGIILGLSMLCALVILPLLGIGLSIPFLDPSGY